MESIVHHPMSGGEWLAVLMLVGIVGGVAISIVAIITGHYRQVALDDMETTLKMEMINRGMSADDIKKILRGKTGQFEPEAIAGLFDAMKANRGSHRRRHSRA